MEQPTHLDLFSGIGGFALAAQWAGFRTIGFCEIDGYCQKVLAKNFMGYTAQREDWRLQQSELSPNIGTGSPIFHDIFDLDGTQFRGVDLITGGFPCQPFSVAGKRGGAADDRAIWPEMFRVIGEVRPAWVLGENVPGIIAMELDNVLSDLEGIGYATRAFVIPACAVDARHRRDRVWIIGRRLLANDNSEYSQEQQRRHQLGETVGAEASGRGNAREGRQWEPEPAILRVAHGVRNRVDRLKGLGNSIVPAVAYEILREIRKLI